MWALKILFFTAMIGLLSCGHSREQDSGIGMFRNNAEHNSYSDTRYDLVYDTRAWQFDAGAPVRSTALVLENFVCFGNTRGDFFALNKKTGTIEWKYHTGYAINSSPACQDGKVYFSDNEQTVFALNKNNGELAWKFRMGEKLKYQWRFDFYYSSPVLYTDKLLIGGDDGNLYMLDQKDGSLVWKFKSKGLVRGSAAVFNNLVLFGDTEGTLYALDIKTGREEWAFKITGEPMNLEEFGFDRKAILAAPVISGDKVVFGARDGFLYCLSAADGKLLWKLDHEISWVISTVAIKDSFVVTGSSDAKFIQAVNLNTGKEIWKYKTPKAVWSSPLINNNRVYEGCYDGQLFCLDLETGQRISEFATNGIIYSSPVLNDSLLYFGSDDGYLYALKGHPPVKQVIQERYVYYDPTKLNIYFRTGADIRIKEFLRSDGFKVFGTDSLVNILSDHGSSGKCIVFATDFFAERIFSNGRKSLLRRFLDSGGRIVLLGNDPLFFNVDEKINQVLGLSNRRVDSVLNLDYGPADTRAFGGQFTGFANERGKYFGLSDYWVSNFGISKEQVDISLGENENGQVSSFIKRFANGGTLIQLWMHPDQPDRLDAVIKLSEWELN